MPEIRSALAAAYQPGRYPADAEPGVHLRELTGWDLVQVAAWRGRFEALCTATGQALGTAPPSAPNRCARADDVEILTTSPGRLWCLAPAGDERLVALETAIDEDTGCVTHIGHSHARVRLAGPAVRRLLAQELALDLSAEVFGADMIARTSLHHVSVVLQCIDADPATPTFDLYLPRTFAGSTWEYLLDLTTPHGYEILERTVPASS